jgi:hypothetical protein
MTAQFLNNAMVLMKPFWLSAQEAMLVPEIAICESLPTVFKL